MTARSQTALRVKRRTDFAGALKGTSQAVGITFADRNQTQSDVNWAWQADVSV